MAIDVVDLRSFYASPLGIVARRLLARAIHGLWPDATGLRVLGIGYATPYLHGLSQGGRAGRRLHAGPPGRRELASGRPVGFSFGGRDHAAVAGRGV